ncbi:ferredoxin [Rhodococcus erythropolis]|jgi:ferredoxin|uniref:Ferredoxin n=1 Tax=Rhodococcus baikonurensis TaxID=172041 RepID=A0ABV5XS96_9NOCA|nr:MULTISPECIES: ferredoxin [Rhodococcus]NHP17456.1 ferredoxin [Rhodococcus sp. IC4_135]MBJ7477548.1 ferredoxin [Rhodococcus sp. (in: high G+C Gram-positive bacteria)]PBI99976.1 Ferredoxin fas2 [Rhodococcus erythropolis]QQM24632.1 ferredoxin [Rhodococcus sp. P-2]RQO50721.1 ferredoxin [Rhodococcus sp. KBW08]
MKIIVDRGRCTGIGICESVSEDYFEVADDGSLILHKELVDDDDKNLVREAVRSCPAKALTLDET